jgi:hypothetical protein
MHANAVFAQFSERDARSKEEKLAGSAQSIGTIIVCQLKEKSCVFV